MRSQFYKKKGKLRDESQQYPVFEGVPSDMRNLMELFLVNYFKGKPDAVTSDQLISMITKKLPGLPLFRNLLLAGVAWTLCGVETQSKGGFRRKFLQKYEHHERIREGASGFYSNRSSIFSSRRNDSLIMRNDIEVIMHELTHALCAVIYNNDCKPYTATDNELKQVWQSYVKDIISMGKIVSQKKDKIDQETKRFYKSISGFLNSHYEESQHSVESIAYLVESFIAFEDISKQFRNITGENYTRVSDLIKRFSNDCYQWAVKQFLDTGFRLIDNAILLSGEVSAVNTATTGDITETGKLFLTEEQARILEEKVPIIDMWLFQLFKNIHTNHSREDSNSNYIDTIYKEYYKYLDDLDHGRLTESSVEVEHDIIKEKLFTYWNEAYKEGKISLQGLFEGIVRYIENMNDNSQSRQLIETYFSAFFKVLDQHASIDPKVVNKDNINDQIFNYFHATNYAAKHFNSDYFEYFLSLVRKRYGANAAKYYVDTIYWFGASGDTSRYKQWKRSFPSGSEEDKMVKVTIKYAISGAIDYGRTELIATLLNLYPDACRVAINEMLNDKVKSLVRYKHLDVIKLLMQHFPEHRGFCSYIYIESCIRSAKNLSFNQVMNDLNIISFPVEDLVSVVLTLAKNRHYAELQELFSQLKDDRNRDILIESYLAASINLNDIELFKNSLHLCNDEFLRANYFILHHCARLNRINLIEYLAQDKKPFFQSFCHINNREGKSPFDVALENNHFRLAALLDKDKFIRYAGKMVSPPTGEQGLEIAMAIAQCGKEYEYELLAYLDKVDVKSFGDELRDQSHPALVDLIVAKGMKKALFVMTVSTRWPEVLKPNRRFSTLACAIEAGNIPIAKELCDSYLKILDQKAQLKLLAFLVKHDCVPLVEYILSMHPDWLEKPLDFTYYKITMPTLSMIATITHSRAVLDWLQTSFAISPTYNPLNLLALDSKDKSIEDLLRNILQQGGGKYFKQADSMGRTPMHFAAQRHSSLATMKLYYNEFPDVDVQDIKGLTPLHYALQDKMFGIAAFLITDCHAKQLDNAIRCRPIHYAAWYGGKDCLKLILAEHPDELNKLTDQGNTPLSAAIQNGHDDIAMYLLRCGADLNAGKYQVIDLIEMAKKHHMHALAKALANKNIESELRNHPIHTKKNIFDQ